MDMTWRSMDTAPKDGTPILGWCEHEADPYFDGERLTAYGANVEGLGHVPNGPHVIQWSEGYFEEDFYGSLVRTPGCWFRYESDFEEPANPIAWAPIPAYYGFQEE